MQFGKSSASVCVAKSFALPGDVVTGEDQHKLIGHVEPVNMEPDAAIGNVHDNTLARQRAVAKLDPRHTIERVARLPAPLVGRQRKHDPGSVLRPCFQKLTTAPFRENTYLYDNCTRLNARARIFLAFSEFGAAVPPGKFGPTI
jgi:hypothetical protein